MCRHTGSVYTDVTHLPGALQGTRKERKLSISEDREQDQNIVIQNSVEQGGGNCGRCRAADPDRKHPQLKGRCLYICGVFAELGTKV